MGLTYNAQRTLLSGHYYVGLTLRWLAQAAVRSLSAEMHSPKSHQQMSHEHNTISSLNGEHYVWEQQWHTSQSLPGHQGYGERSHICLSKGDPHRRYSPLKCTMTLRYRL
jgi:hypothetical protein